MTQTGILAEQRRTATENGEPSRYSAADSQRDQYAADYARHEDGLCGAVTSRAGPGTGGPSVCADVDQRFEVAGIARRRERLRDRRNFASVADTSKNNILL